MFLSSKMDDLMKENLKNIETTVQIILETENVEARYNAYQLMRYVGPSGVLSNCMFKS